MNAVHTIRTTVIQLTPSISFEDVDLGEIADAGNLYVVRGLDEMHALECTIGDGASATSRFGAPCDSLPLRVTNSAMGVSCYDNDVRSSNR